MRAVARIGDEDVEAEQDKQKKREKMKQNEHRLNITEKKADFGKMIESKRKKRLKIKIFDRYKTAKLLILNRFPKTIFT